MDDSDVIWFIRTFSLAFCEELVSASSCSVHSNIQSSFVDNVLLRGHDQPYRQFGRVYICFVVGKELWFLCVDFLLRFLNGLEQSGGSSQGLDMLEYAPRSVESSTRTWSGFRAYGVPDSGFTVTATSPLDMFAILLC